MILLSNNHCIISLLFTHNFRISHITLCASQNRRTVIRPFNVSELRASYDIWTVISPFNDFYQSYSSMAHADSFRINIDIASLNRLYARVLGVSNSFQNTNAPIYETVCFSPPLYYLDQFEISYPNVTIIRYNGPFFFNAYV